MTTKLWIAGIDLGLTLQPKLKSFKNTSGFHNNAAKPGQSFSSVGGLSRLCPLILKVHVKEKLVMIPAVKKKTKNMRMSEIISENNKH